MNKNFGKELEYGIITLSNNDKVMSRIIKKFGKCNLKPRHKYFYSLLNAIIGQQLSLKSAEAISHRFFSYYKRKPTPEKIINTEETILRKLGLSHPKVRYIKDLSEKIINGQFSFYGISKKSNQQIINELTIVKGIGTWTVHMFLIFTLARLDILPVGDLGIKKAIMLNYNLKNLPDEEKVNKIACKYNWHPYESIAAWYLWKSLE